MARPKKQLNRRTDIIEAADILFAKNSFEKTTIEEIAKHIGISKGSVYLDFKNKEDILYAIIERNCLENCEQVELLIKTGKAPYFELLKHIFQEHVVTVFDMVSAHLHTSASLFHTSFEVKQKLSYICQRWQDNTASLLEMAEKNGEFNQFDELKDIAHLLLVSLQGFYPPYDFKYSSDYRTDLSKEQIRALLFTDVSKVLEIFIAGLKSINKSNLSINLVPNIKENI